VFRIALNTKFTSSKKSQLIELNPKKIGKLREYIWTEVVIGITVKKIILTVEKPQNSRNSK